MTGVNLHAIVRGAISAIHQDEAVTLYTAAGQKNVSGEITATYLPPVTAKAQIQSENDEALYQSGNAGQNDITKRFYLYADSVANRPAGLVRPLGRSGDLIQRTLDGTWWLVTAVIEDFSAAGWSSVRATLQTVAPEVVIAE